MIITRKILIRLFDKLKGDYLYDLSRIPAPDGDRIHARCIGYRTKSTSNACSTALLMQRTDNSGWNLRYNRTEFETSYFDPSVKINLDANNMRQIRITKVVFRELLRQRRLQ